MKICFLWRIIQASADLAIVETKYNIQYNIQTLFTEFETNISSLRLLQNSMKLQRMITWLQWLDNNHDLKMKRFGNISLTITTELELRQLILKQKDYKHDSSSWAGAEHSQVIVTSEISSFLCFKYSKTFPGGFTKLRHFYNNRGSLPNIFRN